MSEQISCMSFGVGSEESQDWVCGGAVWRSSGPLVLPRATGLSPRHSRSAPNSFKHWESQHSIRSSSLNGKPNF